MAESKKPEEKKEVKAEVKAAISERDDFGPRFEFAGNGVKVSWTSHEKRVFDARAFCADPKRAELYESFKKTVSERPFKWAITEVRA